ncbi:MAG: hypothetical protein RSC93_03170 [Erysipelotrichaceae bacterium]
MKLYVEANSKNGIGYTPAWIQFMFNGHFEIIFDIHGMIEYDDKSLSCKVKGELEPWVLSNCKTQDEVCLTHETNAVVNTLLSIESIVRWIDWTQPIVLGIWPVDEMADTNSDELSMENGQLRLGADVFPFTFETEIITD